MSRRGGSARNTGQNFRLTAPNSQPERKLQATIVNYFAWTVQPGDAILFAIPNGELRDKATAAILSGPARPADSSDELFLVPQGQGVLPGIQDLLLATAGGVITFIEVKAPPEPAIPGIRAAKPGGKPSRKQRIVREALIKLSHHTELINSLEEFDAILRKRGVDVKTVPFPRMYGMAPGFKFGG